MATGDDFTAYEIINTYKTLLYASDAAVSTIPNEGITGTLKTIRSADGSFSPLQLSSSFVNIDGSSTLKLNGTILTATAQELNTLVSSSGTVQNIRVTATSGLIATEAGVTVSVIDTSATLIVNPSLSITDLKAATGSFTTKVSGAAAEFSGDVSANNLFAATNIFIAGTTIASNADVAAVSARVDTVSARVDAVSVLTSVNKVDIAAVSTRVDAVSVLTSVNKVDVAAVSTRVDAVSVLTSVNKVDIAAVSTRVDTVSASVASNITKIAAVSARVDTVSVSVAANETRIAAVSVLTSVNKADIAAVSVKLVATSAALATSIANHLPLTGGTLTGNLGVSVVSPLKQIHISKSAVANIQQLTDATSIAVDFNAGQNFTVTLAGNRTLENPTNCVAGQVGSIFIIQDGTGSRTLAYGTSWDFPDGSAPTLSTSIDSSDRLDYIVHTSTKVQAILTKAYS